MKNSNCLEFQIDFFCLWIRFKVFGVFLCLPYFSPLFDHKSFLGPFLINTLDKSMDWFLYDKDLRHERVKLLFPIIRRKSQTYLEPQKPSAIFAKKPYRRCSAWF